jgi:hypothetical protein
MQFVIKRGEELPPLRDVSGVSRFDECQERFFCHVIARVGWADTSPHAMTVTMARSSFEKSIGAVSHLPAKP